MSDTDCFCPAFQRVCDADIAVIADYLRLAQYEESNHNIVNLFEWRHCFPLWMHRKAHYLLLIGRYAGTWFLYMPLCEPRYLEEALLFADLCFKEAGVPLVMNCYTAEMKERVCGLWPDVEVIEERDGFDYVYETAKLRTFSGKKLQKKRNHLNAFYQQYADRYDYEAIRETNMADCLTFLDEWNAGKSDPMLKEEQRGIKEVFRLWKSLGASGGLIRIDGRVKAFIVGSRGDDRMGQINIEKADPAIRGLYQAILKEYIDRHLDGTVYLNREDDMGSDALRQAKQAYHPCFMIRKYRLIKHKGASL